MSEQTSTPTPADVAPKAPEPTTTPQGEPADKPLGPNGEKALKAERERADAAERRLKEIETAQLSDLEKAQKQAQEAQTQLAEITRQSTRNAVALAKGVPVDLVDFLTGDTEEEMAARADVLLARISTAPTTPKPDLTQGAARGAAGGTPETDFAAFLKNQMG